MDSNTEVIFLMILQVFMFLVYMFYWLSNDYTYSGRKRPVCRRYSLSLSILYLIIAGLCCYDLIFSWMCVDKTIWRILLFYIFRYM